MTNAAYIWDSVRQKTWCTSCNANDQRAVTIECTSDTSEPYWMNEKVYAKLIELCADICRRNGKKKLLWFTDKNKSLNYMPKSDEMLITVHRWFSNKSCPENWLYERLGAYTVLENAKKKMDCSKAEYLTVEEGLCVQIMHHEIYMSDARKVASEKWKTVIRHPICKNEG